jgi:hypothetical protein
VLELEYKLLKVAVIIKRNEAVEAEREDNFEHQAVGLALECKLNSNVVAKIAGNFTADGLKILNFPFPNITASGRKSK